MSDKIINVACDFIIEQHGKLLLGKRNKCFGKGSWALPGGRVEYGETFRQCIEREMNEELGISPLEISFFGIFEDLLNSGHHIHIAFLIDGFSGNIQLKEPDKCEEWEFFTIDSLPENLFIPQKEIFDRILHAGLTLPDT